MAAPAIRKWSPLQPSAISNVPDGTVTKFPVMIAGSPVTQISTPTAFTVALCRSPFACPHKGNAK